ncbi:MAG: TM2 domain-containing protein [Bacteroidetes bacterium]|nr:MAG: TM2 domain-containing protein [Bacteroidota bacterium]
MKRNTTLIWAVLAASVIIYSCSNSKIQKGSGLAKAPHATQTAKSATSYDYQSAQNYAKIAENYVSKDIAIENSFSKIEAQAITSTDKKLVAITKKHLPQLEKLQKGEKLSLGEALSLKKDIKQAKKIMNADSKTADGGKSQTAAFIIALAVWLLLASIIPIHRFYLGGKKNVTNGILMLIFGILTLGCVSLIWGLIDWIRIATGDLKPGSGEYNPKW